MRRLRLLLDFLLFLLDDDFLLFLLDDEDDDDDDDDDEIPLPLRSWSSTPQSIIVDSMPHQLGVTQGPEKSPLKLEELLLDELLLLFDFEFELLLFPGNCRRPRRNDAAERDR